MNISVNFREDIITRIKFLTSGTLTFQKLNTNTDAFLVGGGSGFNNGGSAVGGGGYYTTGENVSLTTGTPYEVVVGITGKSFGESGKTSSAFGLSVQGENAATDKSTQIGEVYSCTGPDG